MSSRLQDALSADVLTTIVCLLDGSHKIGFANFVCFESTPPLSQKGIYCLPDLTQPAPPKHLFPFLNLRGMFPLICPGKPTLGEMTLRRTEHLAKRPLCELTIWQNDHYTNHRRQKICRRINVFPTLNLYIESFFPICRVPR